jgi:hypothetical protein
VSLVTARAQRKPAEPRRAHLAFGLLMRSAMHKLTIGFGIVLLAASASASPVSGIYKIKFGEYPGTMKIVQDGNFACGTYAGDDGGGYGWVGGAVDGGKLTGLQTGGDNEASGGYPISLTFTGKSVAGTFKEDSKSDDKPWTGSLSAAFPKAPNVSGDYSVEMGGDKIVIHLKQSGTALTGKAEYLYSGKPAGTWKGTISGNMAAGTWDDEKNHGRFQWTHSLNKLSWLAIDGTYGVDRDHCDNGGTIKGGRK